MHIFTSLCKNFGVPMVTDELEGPATSFSFISIILNYCCMEIKLPADKFSRVREIIKAWLPRKKGTKSEILLGLRGIMWE